MLENRMNFGAYAVSCLFYSTCTLHCLCLVTTSTMQWSASARGEWRPHTKASYIDKACIFIVQFFLFLLLCLSDRNEPAGISSCKSVSVLKCPDCQTSQTTHIVSDWITRRLYRTRVLFKTQNIWHLPSFHHQNFIFLNLFRATPYSVHC